MLWLNAAAISVKVVAETSKTIAYNYNNTINYVFSLTLILLACIH